MAAGVYEIVNLVTGQRYIGSSKDMANRTHDHVVALRNGKHRNPKLQASWTKYGEANFYWRQIIICRISDLELYEQLAIDGYGAYYEVGNGFNLRPKAFSPQGRKGSERQKAATRARLLGVPNQKFSEQLRAPERAAKSRNQLNSFRSDPDIEAKRSAAIRSAYADPKKREQQASYVKGLKRSPETIAKLRVAAIAREAKRKATGYVIPRGPNGRILSKLDPGSALGALTGGAGGAPGGA